MSVEFADAQEKAQNRRYHLTCEVHLVDVSLVEHYSKGERQITDGMVFLVPKQSSEQQRFLGTWLPPEVCTYGTGDKYQRPEGLRHFFELGALAGYPIKAPMRLAIFRKDARFPKDHYFLVQSKHAEDELKIFVKSQSRILSAFRAPTISVEILGTKESEEFLGGSL